MKEEPVDFDPTVVEVADLPPGWIAVRERIGGPWRRELHTGYQDED